jgi:hypothetical protein
MIHAVKVDTRVPRAAGAMSLVGIDHELDDDPDEDLEAVHELHGRLVEIRRALDDLGAVTSELAATGGRQEVAARPVAETSSVSWSDRRWAVTSGGAGWFSVGGGLTQKLSVGSF